jgi:hypothetical protein
MSARLRLLTGTLSFGLAAIIVAAPAAGAKTGGAPPVPLQDWAATFCTAFSVYETDALAAQAELQTALGAKDSTDGAATSTSLADVMTKASGSAAAAATAATAHGVPDVTHGRALAGALQATLKRMQKVYAKVAEQASSLPAKPNKLSQAAQRLGTDIASPLAAQGAHGKRLRRLDASNAVANAVSADPTCAAAAKAGGAG